LPRPRDAPARRGRDAVRSLRRSDLRPRDRQRRLRVADVRYRPVAYRTRSRLGEECRRNVPRGHRRHGRASVPAVGRPPARRLPDGAVSPRGPERSERAPATGPPGARRAPPIRGRDRLPDPPSAAARRGLVPLHGTIVRLQQLELGRLRVTSPTTGLGSENKGFLGRTDIDGVIGNAVFEGSRLIVDYARRRVIIEPRVAGGSLCDYDMSGLRLV